MESIRERQRKFEAVIHKTEGRIEALKTEYNLFFSGEVKIPPEKERVNIEKVIRDIQSKDLRSGKLDFLLQNLSSRFYLYNNMWLKKLNQLELGTINRPSKKPKFENKKPPKDASKNSTVSLNNEGSFDSFYSDYDKLIKKSDKSKGKSKEDLINSIKVKMISENIIDAKINLSVINGKVKIKIKK